MLESSCMHLLRQVVCLTGSLRSAALGISRGDSLQSHLYSRWTVKTSSSDGRADLFIIAQLFKCALSSVEIAKGCSLGGSLLHGSHYCMQVTAMP